MGFMPDDFTPTVEEYFWSTVYPRPHRVWTDKSGESAFYFDINMTLASIQAYRKGGETYTVYKWMRAFQAAPFVAAPAIALTWAATGEEHGAVAPGVASGFGMPMTPEFYSGTESDPTGYRAGLRALFGLD